MIKFALTFSDLSKRKYNHHEKPIIYPIFIPTYTREYPNKVTKKITTFNGG